jgi:hypothetical protein
MVPHFIATLVDLIVSPFGFDVYVTAVSGQRGVERIHVMRRPKRAPRPRHIKPHRLDGA